MPRQTFSPTKLQNLIVFILSSLNREVGSVELAKIVYLIDVEKMKMLGETVTGETYTRQEKGPLAKNFGTCLTQMDDFEVNIVIGLSRGHSPIPKKKHTLGDHPRFKPSLDQINEAIAKRVLARIVGLSPWEIEKLAYDTEPMKAITGRESELGRNLLGEQIDFSLVERSHILDKWRANMKKPVKPDPKFDKFLKQEAAEIDQILAALGN